MTRRYQFRLVVHCLRVEVRVLKLRLIGSYLSYKPDICIIVPVFLCSIPVEIIVIIDNRYILLNLMINIVNLDYKCNGLCTRYPFLCADGRGEETGML
jgi:hypothetical protein